MHPLSLQQIEEELLNWNEPVTAESIPLRVVSATNGLEDFLPHPHKEVRVFARPKGLLLVSGSERSDPRHFALVYTALEGVELLPSFVREVRETISWIYVLLCGFLFYMLGGILGGETASIFWLPCGLVFGLLLSMNDNRYTYRRKLRIKMTDGGVILFSVAKKEEIQVTEFFRHSLGERFVVR